MSDGKSFDAVIQQITDYVTDYQINSELALDTAYYDLLDSTACALMALKYPACTKLLGPIVPGAELNNGAKVFGTPYSLDPVQAAFNIGTMVRWLDFNDTFLAAEWGHPSDNIGGILAVMDYLNRQGKTQFTIKDLLQAQVKAHEIQGILALENSFNRVGLDHVVLVKVASTAVVSQILGLSKDQINNAISNAWLDGQALRTYRHFPNTGSRKSWAAGDATSRAVRLSLIAATGEMGYPSALSAKGWGFYDVLFKENSFTLPRPFETYVMENILFKISFPAEFHAQTAVECALALHPEVKDRLEAIEKITIKTQEPAMRIISKQGALNNPADRDHCLEYMVAIPLIYGSLTAEHYENHIAENPLIDQLRNKMSVSEDHAFSRDYLDPDKRAIGNAIKIHFQDGTCTEEIRIDYPIGHKRRRQDGIPLLIKKFKQAIADHFEPEIESIIIEQCLNKTSLLETSVDEWVDRLVTTKALHPLHT